MFNSATTSPLASHNVPQTTEPTVSFDDAVKLIQSGQSIGHATQILHSQLTKAERLSLLDGDVPFWEGLRDILFDRYNRNPFVMGNIARLGIPGVRFTDGPRGVAMHSSTCFPVSMARGATWDVRLEERIGRAIGQEGRAQGANYFAGICINLPRHPAWGRIQETFSEDPIMLAEFGLALHRGVKPYLMTCVKHFALNSMENARFQVDVQVDDAALHQVYLPHFKVLVEAGISSVMSAYNSVRGEYVGQNAELLNDILRKQWGFDGFVLSDFIFGLRDAVKSVQNGLDIEAPFSQQRALHLQTAIRNGHLQWSDVDRSVERILSKLLEHSASTGDSVPPASVVFSDQHRALARETAARSMVLLKNERGLLPIADDEKWPRSIAVVGRLANRANTGDRGSSAVFAPSVVTLYEGLTAAFPKAEVKLENSDSVGHATRIAADSDVVICVVGYDAKDEGEYVVPSFQKNPGLSDLLPPTHNADEDATRARVKGEDIEDSPNDGTQGLEPGAGGDRESLRLRGRDVEIIQAVNKVNTNTIVTLVAAGPIIVEEWIATAPTFLVSWYSGCEGGHALADVLLGKHDASGRLPFSVPTHEEHLPFFDPDATSIRYDQWFGQRLLDKLQVPARFPLGYGLSYTTFALDHMAIDTRCLDFGQDKFLVTAEVRNTGKRDGRYVAQAYSVVEADDFPSRVLLGFSVVDVKAQGHAALQVACSIRPLQRWKEGTFVMANRIFRVELGIYAGDPKSLCLSVSL